MSMPGFNAPSSLSKLTQSYRAKTSGNVLATSSVRPQMFGSRFGGLGGGVSYPPSGCWLCIEQCGPCVSYPPSDGCSVCTTKCWPIPCGVNI